MFFYYVVQHFSQEKNYLLKLIIFIIVGRNQNICTHTSDSECELHQAVVNTHKLNEGAVDGAFGIVVLLMGIATLWPVLGFKPATLLLKDHSFPFLPFHINFVHSVPSKGPVNYQRV